MPQLAFGFPCHTDIPSVQNKPMVGFERSLMGYVSPVPVPSPAVFLSSASTDAVGHPKDVGIYGHGWFVESNCQNHVGSLSSNTRNVISESMSEGTSVEIVNQLSSHASKALCLVVRIGAGAYISEYSSGEAQPSLPELETLRRVPA